MHVGLCRRCFHLQCQLYLGSSKYDLGSDLRLPRESGGRGLGGKVSCVLRICISLDEIHIMQADAHFIEK